MMLNLYSLTAVSITCFCHCGWIEFIWTCWNVTIAYSGIITGCEAIYFHWGRGGVESGSVWEYDIHMSRLHSWAKKNDNYKQLMIISNKYVHIFLPPLCIYLSSVCINVYIYLHVYAPRYLRIRASVYLFSCYLEGTPFHRRIQIISQCTNNISIGLRNVEKEICRSQCEHETPTTTTTTRYISRRCCYHCTSRRTETITGCVRISISYLIFSLICWCYITEHTCLMIG